MANFVNLENLKVGIRKFREQKNFPDDFHNSLYATLLEKKKAGIDENCWDYLIDVLAQWRALRPFSKQSIRIKSQPWLPEIQRNYSRILSEQENEPQITAWEWEQIKGLFDAAYKIKGNDSPVFASKLCHFLFPALYPVADRALINIQRSTYQVYWMNSKLGWISCLDKDQLQKELQGNIHGAIIPSYPWITKITELCYIGSQSPFAKV
jgi:hypothetical protein